MYLACIVALCEQLFFRLEIVAIPVTTVVILNCVQVNLGNKPSSDVIRDGIDNITAGHSIVAHNPTSAAPDLVTPGTRNLQVRQGTYSLPLLKSRLRSTAVTNFANNAVCNATLSILQTILTETQYHAQKAHTARQRATCRDFFRKACLPATATWEVIIDIGNSRQHVHWEWNIREVNTLCAFLRQVPTAAIQRRSKSVLRRWAPAPHAHMNIRPSTHCMDRTANAPICNCGHRSRVQK